jgi:predicted MFS family arabinose efflux permease
MTGKKTVSINSAKALAVACCNTVVGGQVFALLPIILGTVADHLLLDAAHTGIIASVYFGGFTVTTISSVLWLRRLGWRYISASGVILVLIGFLLPTVYNTMNAFLIGFALAGAGGGIAYAFAVGMISDMDDPDRKFAIKMIPEALVPALLMITLPILIIKPWGFNGLISTLIVVSVLPIFLLTWTPQSGRVRDNRKTSCSESNTSVFFALAALFVFCAGFAGVWGFLERIAAENNMAPKYIGVLLSLSLISSGVSPFVVAIIGSRYGRSMPMICGTVVSLISMTLFLGHLDALRFGVIAIFFPGGVYIVFAYLFAIIAEADKSGKYAPLMASALAFASGLGPGIFGAIKSTLGNSAALGMSALLITVGVTLAVVLNSKIAVEKKITVRRKQVVSNNI